jgi:hypothetical protein
MPIELFNAIKTTGGWSFASKGMNNLFINKLYTSAILTIVVILLIMILYPCKKNTPVYMLGKLGFYIFITSLSIIFIHDCVVYNKNKSNDDISKNNEFVDTIGDDDVVYRSDKVIPVIPAIDIENSKSESNIIGGDIGTDSVFDEFGV